MKKFGIKARLNHFLMTGTNQSPSKPTPVQGSEEAEEEES
jgi:hypothetical protein